MLADRRLKAAMILAAPLLLSGALAAGLRSLDDRPDYCGYCHVMERYYRSWTAPGLAAHRHALASVTCQSCHPRSLGQLVREIAVTVRGAYQEPLPVLRLGKEQCLACHGSYAALARATSGLAHNPHAAHIGEEECHRCHAMHRPSQGMKYCTTCHHTGDLVRCRNCHPDK